MKALLAGIVFFACSNVFAGQAESQKEAASAKATAADATASNKVDCGGYLKSKAALPLKLSELLTSVSDFLDLHAKTMGQVKDPAARGEVAFLRKISKDHRTVAKLLAKTGNDMATNTVKAVEHDMSKADPHEFELMAQRAKLAREMAALLQKEAAETEKMLADIKAGAAK